MLRNPEATVYDIESINHQIDFLKRNVDLNKIASCLEIGAHTGHFLKALKKDYNFKIYYDELSSEALEILNLIPDFHDFNKNKNKVDLIILRHVLEHINDLDSFIQYVENSLTKNGKIFIEVPDWTILDKETDAFMFEHLSQFNDKCLVDLFRRKGFRNISIERSINKNDPSTPNRVMRLIFSRTVRPQYGEESFNNFFMSYFHNKHDKGRVKLNQIYSSLGRKKSVFFFPASNLSFSAIMETDIDKINLKGYFDSDEKKKGREFLGYKVFSPDELKKINPEIIFIFSEAYEPEIRDIIRNSKTNPQIFSYSNIFSNND
tara:strand:- start:26 stop:982 length:957 start_codon:yes stop_codon:yes gene_type:complete